MRKKALEFELDTTSEIGIVNAIELCIEEKQPIILRVNETVGLNAEYLDRLSALPYVTVCVGQGLPVRRNLLACVLVRSSPTFAALRRVTGGVIHFSLRLSRTTLERVRVCIHSWLTKSGINCASPSIVRFRKGAKCTTSPDAAADV